MSCKGNKLLRPARPEPGESSLGFLLRLTELNGYENPAWIPRVSGLGGISFAACRFVFGESQDLNLLSELTGCEKAELASLLYEPAPSDTSTFRNYAFGLPIPKYLIRPRNPKICPDCLREDGYCRKVWELAPVTACPNHGVVLLDECQNCRNGIPWFRKEVCVCACGYDWRNIKSEPVNASALHLSRLIHSKCGLLTRGLPRVEPGSPLENLDLEDLLSAVFFIAAQHTGTLDTTGKFTAVDRSNAELHEILTKAVSVFEDWPKRFEQFILWRQNRFPPRKTVRAQTGLHKDFGSFYFGLYHSLPSACFAFMRTAFEKYVEAHWDGGYTSAVGRHRGLRLTHKKYVGLTEAALTLGTWLKWVNRLIENGRLKAVVRVKGKRRVVLVERASLERLKLEFNESLGIAEAARLLGVSMPAVKDLMGHRFITPLRGLTVDGFKNWRFSRETIDGLLEQLEKRIAPQGAATAISFSAALAKVGGYCSGLGGFVKVILDGGITPCGKSEGTGLYKFSFSEEQIIEYVRSKRGRAYHVAEAAKLLGVTTEIVSFLIKKRIIPTGASTSQSELPLDAEGINTFTSTHTLASKLAASLHTSSEFVVDALEACGILPVSGMKVDGGPAYLFRNSDLEAVNFAEAVSKQRVKYRPSDSKLKVNIEGAAEILGVDTQTVRSLVDNGVLRPHSARSGKNARSAEVRFTTFILEGFKKRFAGDVSLAKAVVSHEVAVKTLGMTGEQFYVRLLRTERLKPVKLKTGGKLRFFLREDVTAIAGSAGTI